MAADANRSGVGMRGAAQRVEQRGFAGAVWTDDGLHDASRHVKVEAIKRDEAAKSACHASRDNDRLRGQRARVRRTANCDASEARPPGASTITAITPRP